MLFHFMSAPYPVVYTLSLHDALPISRTECSCSWRSVKLTASAGTTASESSRSEEHTSELQSQFHLVCRLLLEKKNVLLPAVRFASVSVPLQYVVSSLSTLSPESLARR